MSERWKIDLLTLRQYSRYFDFESLAKKYGLWEDYKLDYSILSLFLHPTDLYIMTTMPIPGTMLPEREASSVERQQSKNYDKERIHTYYT